MRLKSKYKRRHILKVSSSLFALPWLETSSFAANPEPSKRIVNICTNFGLYGPAFFPEGTGTNYKASEYLQLLGDLSKNYTVFSGISHPEIGGDHASEISFLTSAKHPTQPGFRNSVSMDVVAAKNVAQQTRFPLITLSTLGNSPLSHTEFGAQIPA